MKNYESIVEEETLREMASWPEGSEFETLEPMMRITLNIILRAIFGADGARTGDAAPDHPAVGDAGFAARRVADAHPRSRALDPVVPAGASTAVEYDAVIDTLIDQAKSDPRFDERTDVLALLLRSTYEDGSPMSRSEIADELLTLLAAGHETTASTLAWTFERISRHPGVLAELVAEADTDGNEYRQATILEVQRNRTVIDFAGRHVLRPQRSSWANGVSRKGYSVSVALGQAHSNAREFPDPERFDPQRFVGNRPNIFAWIPFGGGTRRCVGAAFANMEMDVVLRTVLRRLHHRDHDRARREVALARRRLHPEEGRPDHGPASAAVGALQAGSRPMKPISRVTGSASAPTSTAGPYCPDERSSSSIADIPSTNCVRELRVEIGLSPGGCRQVPGVHVHIGGVEAVDGIGEAMAARHRMGEHRFGVGSVEQRLDPGGVRPPRRGRVIGHGRPRGQFDAACGQKRGEPVDQMAHHIASHPSVDRCRRRPVRHRTDVLGECGTDGTVAIRRRRSPTRETHDPHSSPDADQGVELSRSPR